MARGASAHFFLKGMEWDRYYPIVLGVFENNDFLVSDTDRSEDMAILKGIPRSGQGFGIEVEIRRRPKGVDAHILVVPAQDLPANGRFLSREGVHATLHRDDACEGMLDTLLPSLRRDDARPTDPTFRTAPNSIPDWVFFQLKGGPVSWILGTVLGMLGVAYLLFWSPLSLYAGNEALFQGLAFLIAPWFAGICSRTASRGYVAGFLAVCLPAAFYIASAAGLGLPGLRRDPGVYLLDVFLGPFTGPAALLAPIIAGLLCGIPAAIAGAVGGKIFPVDVKRPASFS